jgi:hypothetical protein
LKNRMLFDCVELGGSIKIQERGGEKEGWSGSGVTLL